MNDLFRLFATKISRAAGSSKTFVFAISIVLIWACLGPLFNYSTNWQLVINTTTTIVTFLMVFLIQNAQNRDTKALHLKLDELLRASKPAGDHFIDVENANDEELEALATNFTTLHDKAVLALEHRKKKRSGK